MDITNCLYPNFREERRRFASFAWAPSHMWALRRAQSGYFFLAHHQATLCFGCGRAYPLHQRTCPRSHYNIPWGQRPQSSAPSLQILGINLRQCSSQNDREQNEIADPVLMNIHLRVLQGTESVTSYSDFNVRRLSFRHQRTRCTPPWACNLANAGFYARKSVLPSVLVFAFMCHFSHFYESSK